MSKKQPDETETRLLGVYESLVTLAREGKYRERVEILRTLESMHWWDNWGHQIYTVRMSAIVAVAELIDDIPEDLQTPIEEARDVSAGFVGWL